MGRQVVKSCLPTSIIRRKSESIDYSRVYFFLDWWPLLLSQEWWGHIWYMVYGSLVVCHWMESVVSSTLSCNQWLIVPEVLDPDNNSRALRRAGG
jgi:hypothetical protein